MHRPTLTLLFALCLTGAPAFAADQPAAAPLLDERVDVRLVETTLLARHRDGTPALGLGRDDFRVKSGGRDLQIAYVEALEAESPTPLAGPLRLVLEDRPGAPEEVVTALANAPRHFVLLIDVDNDDPLERDRALADVRRFVSRDLEPHDRVAVFAYDGELHLEASFSPSHASAADAVARAYGRPSSPRITLDRRVDQLLEQLGGCTRSRDYVRSKVDVDAECVRGIAAAYLDESKAEARSFFDALDGAVRYAAGLGDSGASVIALTHGVTLDRSREFTEALRALAGDAAVVNELESTALVLEDQRDLLARTVAAAAREGVALHFLDRSRVPTGAISARRGELLQPGFDPVRAAFDAPRQELELVARETGGIFVANRDLGAALGEALATERGRYRIGFYLPEDSTRHDLERARIDVVRAGIDVRQGRATMRTTSVAAPRPEDARIAIGRSKEAEGGAGRFVPYAIVVDPALLAYEQAGAEMASSFTLHLAVQDESGRTVADVFRFLTHAYPADVWARGDAEPVSLTGWVEMPPGSFRLVARVRPAKSEREIEIQRSLTVPAP